ncbi:MAG TPA: tetratricopeptide repeat protein [Balneolaceae bacterium]|nr:tetratricopeptide repeat protein [Balneolaceae bacterium]
MPASNNTIKKLARNIKKNPDDSFSKFALALEFLKQDNLKRAKILFEDVYKNDPEYVGVYYHLAKLYERLGKPRKAKKIYEEGLDVATAQGELRTKKELNEALTQLNVELEDE